MSETSQRDRMARMSGTDRETAPKYVVPAIKFNGNSGEYAVIDLTKDNRPETKLDMPVEVIILKARKALQSFTSTESFFTNEYSSANQKVNLYKRVDGAVTFIESATPMELKEKHQLLKTKQVLYVLHDGIVKKLDIKGGSQMGYFDYLNSLKESDLHAFEVYTSMTSEKTKSEAGFGYFKIIFNQSAEKPNLDMVEKSMAEVSAELTKIDEYFLRKMLDGNGSDNARTKSVEEINADLDFDKMGSDDIELD